MKPKKIVEQEQEEPIKKYQPPKSIKPIHQKFLADIGNRLEELRKSKGISTLKLTKESGISRTLYYQMINGRVYFNTYSLMQILDYYEIPPENFFKEF